MEDGNVSAVGMDGVGMNAAETGIDRRNYDDETGTISKIDGETRRYPNTKKKNSKNSKNHRQSAHD